MYDQGDQEDKEIAKEQQKAAEEREMTPEGEEGGEKSAMPEGKSPGESALSLTPGESIIVGPTHFGRTCMRGCRREGESSPVLDRQQRGRGDQHAVGHRHHPAQRAQGADDGAGRAHHHDVHDPAHPRYVWFANCRNSNSPQNLRRGRTGIRTQVFGFKVQRNNHYTIPPTSRARYFRQYI